MKGATPYTRNPETGKLFQSAPPVKGATGVINSICRICRVSIRAPREGGDDGVHKFKGCS